METNLDHILINSRNQLKWYQKKSNWIRIGALFMFILFIIIAISNYDLLKNKFLKFIEWMEHNTLIGSISFIILFCISNVLLIPGSLLTFGAGFVYCHVFGLFKGVFLSSILVFIAACIGATLSFLNGRYLLRNIVQHYTQKSPRFVLIERIVRDNGFKVVLLLRLSPLIPYNFFNIFMGITSVKLKDYCLAHIAMLPETIICCFLGGTISHIYQLTQQNHNKSIKALFIIITIIGTLIAFCGIYSISKVAKKEFDKLRQELDIVNGEDTEIQHLVDNDNNNKVLVVETTNTLMITP